MAEETLPPGLLSRLRGALKAVWALTVSAGPESPAGLSLLRVGVCCILILQAVSLKDYLYPLVGRLGIMQPEITEHLTSSYLPRIGLAVRLGETYGFGEEQVIAALFTAYLFSLCLLALGLHTRGAALLAWLLHLSFNTSGVTSIYGVHEFTNIALFYCCVMPVGDAFSIDAWRRPEKAAASIYYSVCRRVLQWHMCIVYFSSGVEKALGEQWWNGEAVWRALMREGIPASFAWLAEVPPAAMALCWGTMLLEAGYVFFIWPRRTRKIALALVTLFHASIAFFLGLWFFSGSMIVLNLASFYPFAVTETAAAPAPLCLKPAELYER